MSCLTAILNRCGIWEIVFEFVVGVDAISPSTEITPETKCSTCGTYSAKTDTKFKNNFPDATPI